MFGEFQRIGSPGTIISILNDFFKFVKRSFKIFAGTVSLKKKFVITELSGTGMIAGIANNCWRMLE